MKMNSKKYKMKKSILLSVILLLIFYYSNAQSWDLAKNFKFGSQNCGVSIRTDNAQNIYFTNGFNALFTKCDNSGNIIWVDTLAVAGVSTTDINGNTYFAGGNRIAKYDNAGNKLWIVTTNIPNDYFTSIDIHPVGGIVVVGKTGSNTSKSILSHYDENGNLLWTKTGEFFPGGEILKCDNLGNVYIVGGGQKDSVSGNYGFLVKYTGSGNLLYSEAIPATVNGMAIDNKNNGNYIQ